MKFDTNADGKSKIDIWVILFTTALVLFGVGSIIHLEYPRTVGVIWDAIRIILGPLIGAFVGVSFGFRKNTKYQKEQNYKKKLLLLNILRHEVRKSIELLQENSGNLIPMDAWNSIIYSGNITLFTHQQATELGDIYSRFKNYNYEAKRTRDASERFNLLAEPYQRQSDREYIDHKNWRMAKERWEKLSKNLATSSDDLISKLSDLEKAEWFNEVLRES